MILKPFLLKFLFLLFAMPVFAHPGIGIVQDSKGNVFYTDLNHVWKISTDGKLSIAVRDVHTHQLHVDAADNLYGEHVWYSGEATDKWWYYVWRLSASGELSQAVTPTEGFPENNTLVRDENGNSYYAVNSGDAEQIYRQTDSGLTTTFCSHDFQDIRWMKMDEKTNRLLVIDLLKLYSVDPEGNISLISEDLEETKFSYLFLQDRHKLMGTWSDQEENIYVAVYSGKKIKKISPYGNVSTVYESQGSWSPTGGLIAGDGSMWVLEYSRQNKARVVKISKSGTLTYFGED